MALSDTDIAELRHREETLWTRHTRFDRDYMERVMSEDFVEFGRSGRRYSRADCLAFPDQPLDATLRDIDVHEIAPSVALVTYRSELRYAETEVSWRSSVWVKTDVGWLLRFHQGTPTTA
ncbi:MAG: DUF4440 domain-containing protein [Actinophytocola sp.]|nr:DUF4440 domain-containing protein [Actinophytocola sp.]